MGLIERLQRSVERRGLRNTYSKVVENVVYDTRDMVRTRTTPPTVYEDIPKGAHLPVMDTLFGNTRKRDLQSRLWREAENLSPGTYGMLQPVGIKEEGTAHPHFFVVDRGKKDTTFLFVDPEHHLNKNERRGRIIREGDVRAKVCNIMAVHLSGATVPPDVAIMRFRTSEISDPSVMSFQRQLAVARDAFSTNGLPKEFEDKENEIILRLVVAPSSGKPMLLQSRYARSGAQLRKFLTEGQMENFPFLRGKIKSFQGVMEEFIAHLNRGEFTLKPNIQTKA